jgi:hypothetical protein
MIFGIELLPTKTNIKKHKMTINCKDYLLTCQHDNGVLNAFNSFFLMEGKYKK